VPATPEREAALLGLLHGAAELVPISSSAHVAALPWLLGWEVASWPDDRRKELQVALHAGTVAALAARLVPPLREWPLTALAAAPPAVAALAFERQVETRLGGPGALAGGLLAGSAALAWADRRPQRRRRASATLADGAWLGLAQAAALAPGVSRTGATLAVARARGFRRPDASALSFAIAGPVLAGAALLKGVRVAARGTGSRPLAAGAAASCAGTLAARRALGLERRAPLWPWALERALLAAAILAVRYGRRR
jgi:undecaprenyl-diphosphatase